MANSTPNQSLPNVAVNALMQSRFPAMNPRGTLLFAHGFGQTRLAWKRTAYQLAQLGFSGTTFDARGHGESPWNACNDPYHIDQFVGDLTQLTKSHSEPPVLIGASMGGLLGLFAQAQQPIFRALVLVDITPRWDARGVERILDFMTAYPHGFEHLDQAADAIAQYLPHRTTRKSPQELEKLLVQQPDGRWRWHWDPRLIDTIGRSGDMHQATLLEAARAVEVPTLLISGGRSELVQDEHVRECLELIPHAHHVRLPDATHMVVGDDNDAFTQTISAFLTALPPGNPF